MKFVQAALPHEDNEKLQWSSWRCPLNIETVLKTVLRKEGENSEGGVIKKKKKGCCKVFIDVCVLFVKNNARHNRSCSFCGLSQEAMGSVSLAKFSKVTNCKLLWFQFLTSHPIECCLLVGTVSESGDRSLLPGGCGASNQPCHMLHSVLTLHLVHFARKNQSSGSDHWIHPSPYS